MINRWLRRFLCLLIALASALSASAQNRTSGEDGDITYYNRTKKKEETLRGTIEKETPKEIVVSRTTRNDKVAAVDVLDVAYQIPADLRLEVLGKARKQEAAADRETDLKKRGKDIDDAIASYKELIDKLGKRDGHPLAQRHYEYQIARLLARAAENDASRMDDAVAALSNFKSKHNGAWQIDKVGRLLARVQVLKGDLKTALAVYDEFAARDDLAEAVRQQYALLGIKALLRPNNFADAERKLTNLSAKLSPDDPQAVRVQIYLAGCKAKSNLPEAEKRLKTIINSDADGALKGLACNTLGDCYRLNNRLEDAFWQYLMTEVEFSQDRDEHAKALYYLADLFGKAKNRPERGQACLDRLLSDRIFAGSDFQRQAARDQQKAGQRK